MVLVELGVVEQRFQAVLEVLGGASVTDVARRYGVVRQTVHRWLRRYAESGVSGLADRSSKPESCLHQMPAPVEARIVELRHGHPGWGPRSIGYQLGQEGVEPVPSRSMEFKSISPAPSCSHTRASSTASRYSSRTCRRIVACSASGTWTRSRRRWGRHFCQSLTRAGEAAK